MVIEEIPPVVEIRSAVSAASVSSTPPHKMMDMPRHKVPKWGGTLYHFFSTGLNICAKRRIGGV